jgi:hypothetical protein
MTRTVAWAPTGESGQVTVRAGAEVRCLGPSAGGNWCGGRVVVDGRELHPAEAGQHRQVRLGRRRPQRAAPAREHHAPPARGQCTDYREAYSNSERTYVQGRVCLETLEEGGTLYVQPDFGWNECQYEWGFFWYWPSNTYRCKILRFDYSVYDEDGHEVVAGSVTDVTSPYHRGTAPGKSARCDKPQKFRVEWQFEVDGPYHDKDIKRGGGVNDLNSCA